MCVCVYVYALGVSVWSRTVEIVQMVSPCRERHGGNSKELSDVWVLLVWISRASAGKRTASHTEWKKDKRAKERERFDVYMCMSVCVCVYWLHPSFSNCVYCFVSVTDNPNQQWSRSYHHEDLITKNFRSIICVLQSTYDCFHSMLKCLNTHSFLTLNHNQPHKKKYL